MKPKRALGATTLSHQTIHAAIACLGAAAMAACLRPPPPRPPPVARTAKQAEPTLQIPRRPDMAPRIDVRILAIGRRPIPHDSAPNWRAEPLISRHPHGSDGHLASSNAPDD